jgi:ice-binding like protein
MVRPLGFPRVAAGLVVIRVALVAALTAACGGSDVVDSSDASMLDGLAPSPLLDGTVLDAGALPDGGALDVAAGLPDADAALPDADAALPEASVFDSGTGALMQSLGTAAPFVVLSGATVTNAGSNTVLLGDVGTTGPAITGLTGPPFQPSGQTDIDDARATQAVLDVETAHAALAARACPPANDLTGLDLGGMTLAPGVYCFSSTAGQAAATTLTFDAKGDPDAVWVIQVTTALTIMNDAKAVVIGGPLSLACRIFWTVGTAATMNGGSQSLGNMLASTATSMLTNATLSPGRAFGQTAGVTLLSNTVSIALCP